ncbi:hydratase [Stappia stellulata]|uniref:2-keto-4-pentenoate hydratase n=1 Tax=Stappia stellulata TaxID=71235 RepID=UPI001CD33A3C|nr:hydratase [Stappia stellulata]MCA1243865.1 hydratase [Stappia stellulata]
MNGQDATRGEIARSLLEVARRAGSSAPVTDRDPGFDLAAAYGVSAEIRAHRIAGGETPVGWKIGFTNRTIWDEYDVHAPIWGPVYDSTVDVATDDTTASCGVARLMEPRIEPEIVFRVARPLRAGSSEAELLACIDGVALGFELVQSPYPDWRFRAPDTVAAFALHGLLRHRPFVAVTDDNRDGWFADLSAFTLSLAKDGEVIDRGASENVLGGPLSALKAMVDGLPATALAEPVGPGMIVTTGTLTRAFPVAPGETWATRVEGVPLADIALEITA